MKIPAPLVSGLVALGAVVGLGMVFVNSASPYATVALAKEAKGGSVHVVGKIVPGTISQNSLKQTLQFELVDETGKMQVAYKGVPMANLETAERVVVVGQCDAGIFNSEKMLVKCPSKYEGNKTGG